MAGPMIESFRVYQTQRTGSDSYPASRVLRLLLANGLGLFALGFILGCSAASSRQNEKINFLGEMFREETARQARVDVTIPPTSEAHFEFMRGELAYTAEQYDAALAAYQRAAELEPGTAPVLRTRLAQIYIRKGELKQALTQLELAEKGYPSEDPNRSEVLELRAGVLASLKRTEEAILTYRALIAIPTTNPNEEAYVLLAGLYANERRFTEAEQTLRELLKKAPESPIGVYYLARIYEMQGFPEKAEENYRRAILLSPETDTLQLDLARVLGIQKKFQEAVSVAEQVVENSPQNQAAQQLLGQLLLGGNRYDDALKHYEQLRDTGGDAEDARLKIALIKLERREFLAAETELSLILANAPNNSLARYYLALAQSGQGKVQDTIQTATKIQPGQRFYRESRILGAFLLRQDRQLREAAEFLSPLALTEDPDPKLLTLIGSLQREGGLVKDAIATIERLSQVDPNNDAHFFLLGVLYDDGGMKQDAMQAMRRAIEINPANDEALNYLGYSLAERGESLEEAQSLVQRAIEIEPQNGYYIDSLAWVYHRRGLAKEALSAMEKAISIVPNDAVLLEHYAVILDSNGLRTQALATVERAIEAAPQSDDKEVLSRLRALQAQFSSTDPDQAQP